MQSNRRTVALLILGASVALLVGCDRREGVSYYQAPKDRSYAAAANLQEQPFWKTPQGWSAVPAEHGGTILHIVAAPDLSAAIMPVPAANPQSPNVGLQNALEGWGQQMGLDLKDEKTLDRCTRNSKVSDDPAFIFDLKSPANAKRTLITAIARGEVYWCVVLQGPAAAVEAQKPAYESLVGSMRFAWVPTAEAEPTTQPAPMSPQTGQGSEISWKLPEGWTAQPTKPMTFAVFAVASGDQRAEISITQMSRAGFEQMKLMNINRWRGLVGMPPTDDPNANPPKPVDMAGGKGFLLDLSGQPSGGTQPRMLVAWCALGPELWFVKLQGPADLVDRQQPAFVQFIQSIRFGGKPIE